MEWFQVGEDFIHAAILAELLTIVKHFNAAEIGIPFVVERPVRSSPVLHPEARAIELDAVTARQNEIPAEVVGCRYIIAKQVQTAGLSPSDYHFYGS